MTKAAPPDTKWLTPTEQAAWRGFLLAARLVMDQLHRELQDSYDLSLTDYGILVRLSEEPNRRLRMTELAASSGLSKSRLSHQMTRLEQRGLTMRENCPDDARGTLAALTDTGYELLSAASHVHVPGVRAALLDHFDGDQVAELARWTKEVVQTLDPFGRSGPLLPDLMPPDLGCAAALESAAEVDDDADLDHRAPATGTG